MAVHALMNTATSLERPTGRFMKERKCSDRELYFAKGVFAVEASLEYTVVELAGMKHRVFHDSMCAVFRIRHCHGRAAQDLNMVMIRMLHRVCKACKHRKFTSQ